ncbi:GNAT family N-acetyltransferase [Arthrobacter sp. 1P04PC]|uniref:GNAT family N-acetyltransferase n=1 Tax=unclassified Arthrobacter TaxID=235627 RepID=UPI0039A33548
MGTDLVVRRCTDRELAALEAGEPPGSGIARRFLREQAAGNIVFAAAWRDEQLLGTVVLDFRSEEAPELKHLHVQEAFRGAGAGTAMCRWIEAQAERSGFGKLYLGVGADNPGARRLYQRLGFTFAGRSTTTTYQYVDHDGQKQWATETDDILEKTLSGREFSVFREPTSGQGSHSGAKASGMQPAHGSPFEEHPAAVTCGGCSSG